MTIENPPAFPATERNDDGSHHISHTGMTLRDWFAGVLPPPSRTDIDTQQKLDRARNPHNDPHKPKLRTEDEIVAALRYRAADALLAARTGGEK